MPIFWDESQLEWLEGSYLLKQIEDRKHNIATDHDTIARVPSPSHTAASFASLTHLPPRPSLLARLLLTLVASQCMTLAGLA